MATPSFFSEAFQRGAVLGFQDGRERAGAAKPGDEWKASVDAFLAQPGAKLAEQPEWTAGYRHGFRRGVAGEPLQPLKSDLMPAKSAPPTVSQTRDRAENAGRDPLNGLERKSLQGETSFGIVHIPSDETERARKERTMRNADDCEVIEADGLMFKIETRTDPTDLPWDGDEPLDEGAEGWDVLVEATIVTEGLNLVGFSSLGSIWIIPNPEGIEYLREETRNVRAEAIAHAVDQLRNVAAGEAVAKAKSEQKIAKGLVAKLVTSVQERA